MSFYGRYFYSLHVKIVGKKVLMFLCSSRLTLWSVYIMFLTLFCLTLMCLTRTYKTPVWVNCTSPPSWMGCVATYPSRTGQDWGFLDFLFFLEFLLISRYLYKYCRLIRKVLKNNAASWMVPSNLGDKNTYFALKVIFLSTVKFINK